MRAAAMRCCASKRSTSTRSEAGAPETPRASPDEGVAAATSAVKASHQSHQKSIRVVASDDEPAGWPATDPCASDDGAGARTSTSAFAEGCVAVDAREVARSIAAELLTKRAHDRRDVFSVRRSGTDASSAHVSSDDFEFDPPKGFSSFTMGIRAKRPIDPPAVLYRHLEGKENAILDADTEREVFLLLAEHGIAAHCHLADETCRIEAFHDGRTLTRADVFDTDIQRGIAGELHRLHQLFEVHPHAALCQSVFPQGIAGE